MSSEEIAERLRKISMSHFQVRAEYIEMMAAAYLTKTNIDPADVELVEQRLPDGGTKWWFQKKGIQVKRG